MITEWIYLCFISTCTFLLFYKTFFITHDFKNLIPVDNQYFQKRNYF